MFIEEDAVPNSHVTTEQRNVETSHGASSAAAASAEPDMLKTTVTGLQQDPSQPSNNPTDSASRVIVDKGPGQSLKHTSGPFQKESDKLVGDLQGKNTLPETKGLYHWLKKRKEKKRDHTNKPDQLLRLRQQWQSHLQSRLPLQQR